MPTRNFDSSLLIQRRDAKALASFANAVTAANNANGGYATLLRTQNNDQRASIMIQQKLGKCYCTQDSDPTTRYAFNPSGGPCGCGLGR
jgi:hypothetical protein